MMLGREHCTVSKLISMSLKSETKSIQITLEGTIIMNERKIIMVQNKKED